MATFLLNTHQFDESLLYWSKVKNLIRERKDLVEKRDLDAYVDRRYRHTKFGKYSTLRDASYANGNGNITEAKHWAMKQLGVYPNHPEVHFDLGVLNVMTTSTTAAASSKGGKRGEDKVLESLAASHRSSVKGWLAEKRVNGRYSCSKLAGVVYGWTESTTVNVDEVLHSPSSIPAASGGGGTSSSSRSSTAFVPPPQSVFRSSQVYLAHIKGASLEGRDGLISVLSRKRGRCQLLVPSAGVFYNLPANLQMRAHWNVFPDADRVPEASWPPHDHMRGAVPFRAMVPPNAPRPKILERAVSIVQYASLSYYHFVMEVLARLVAILGLLENDTRMKLVVPYDESGSSSFVEQFFRILVPSFVDDDGSDRHRLVRYSASSLVPIDTRLRVKDLYYVNWHNVTHETGSDDEEGGVLLHAVAPAPLLRDLRDILSVRLWKGTADDDDVHVEGGRTTPKTVILCSRQEQSMRRLRNFDALEQALRVETSAGRLDVFNGNRGEVREQMTRFRRASVVVGVHGGALANIVACRPGTLVIEIGFDTPQSMHYAHAAAALGLEYLLIEVDDLDELAMGAMWVDISDENTEAIRSAVRWHLRGDVGGRATGGSGGGGDASASGARGGRDAMSEL
eukprot:g3740.t1